MPVSTKDPQDRIRLLREMRQLLQNIEQLQTEAGSLVVLGHVQEPVYCASGSNWEILCDDAVLDAQMPSL
jgi:hypothetical protein